MVSKAGEAREDASAKDGRVLRGARNHAAIVEAVPRGVVAGPLAPSLAPLVALDGAPFRREQVKTVMAYAGSRMLWSHPILSLRHWLDGFRKAPAGV